MDQDLFRFVINTSKESFLQSREAIISHEQYDPYSDDLEEIEALLGDAQFEQVIDFHTLNTLLSPRAHLIKRMAMIESGQPDEGNLELLIAQKILECMDLTGDGSAALPLLVTRISDERDYLSYIGEEFAAQALQQQQGRYLDVITTTTGRNLHFDITDCYRRMQELHNRRTAVPEPVTEAPEPETEAIPETFAPKRKWWKFW